jgi:serine/threonine protein kinase
MTTSNLLIVSRADSLPGVTKLIDFGHKRQRLPGVVTVWCAMELVLGDMFYTQKIDIWSASCIFAELCPEKCSLGPETNPSNFNPQQICHVPKRHSPTYDHAPKSTESTTTRRST